MQFMMPCTSITPSSVATAMNSKKNVKKSNQNVPSTTNKSC